MKFGISVFLLASSITTRTTNGFVVGNLPSKHHATHTFLQSSSPSALFFDREDTTDIANNNFVGSDTQLEQMEEFIVSPVLQIVYPKLIEWKQEYGHPNIPLGTKEGRQCATLRRLHIQKKLTEQEVEWLEELGFLFHSLEDVYHHVDFDTLFQRLLDYETKHPDSNFQVPKKCPEDPELGAWVTGLRRLGPNKVDPKHAQQLDQVGFVWVSKSKCGSKFMLKYKELVQRVEDLQTTTCTKQQAIQVLLLEDSKVKDLIQAQKQLEAKKKMSETRMNYMNQLFGEDWTSLV